MILALHQVFPHQEYLFPGCFPVMLKRKVKLSFINNDKQGLHSLIYYCNTNEWKDEYDEIIRKNKDLRQAFSEFGSQLDWVKNYQRLRIVILNI
jgi:hypothetical protein